MPLLSKKNDSLDSVNNSQNVGDDFQKSDPNTSPLTRSIVIIAGEESGDQHAAHLVQQLKIDAPNIQFSGIGGVHMEIQGVKLLYNLAQFGVTGFTEVLKHFTILKTAFQNVLQHIIRTQPSLIILVDYPGFNLRLLKKIKQHTQIPVLYYISPQIWAWKANRIKLIQRYVDHMAVILPFEKKLYQTHHVPVSFTGHPLVRNLQAIRSCSRADFDLPTEKRLIALLPGSRLNEIERHMPVLLETAKTLIRTHLDLHFVIPVASSLSIERLQSAWHSEVPCTFIAGHALEIGTLVDLAIVASGTASLEYALLKVPLCIIYRASYLTYLLASHFIKVRYLGLCNILSDRMIAPEFLQYDCNAKELSQTVSALLTDKNWRTRIKRDLDQLYDHLSDVPHDESLNQIVLKMLGTH